MSDLDLGFVHRFEPGRASVRPVLLLHGTGGDETDVLPLGRMVAPGAALLSPRGPVLENGMPRFFRRLSEGVFDEADVRRRAADLAGFVAAARARYDLAAPVALGFSNGANIAAAMLLLHPEALAGAVLLRAMAPLATLPPPTPDSRPAEGVGRHVLMLSGANDPIVPGADAARLAAQLAAAGARVEHAIVPGGHGLSRTDMVRIGAWMAEDALLR